MPSWAAEPARVDGRWTAFRQVSPDWAPLYHAAGEPQPSQQSGRWHRVGDAYAQYMSLDSSGAWAELIRFENIRGDARAEQYRRTLWVFSVQEQEIADLSSFDHYVACGLDPSLAVGEHEASQALADELRTAGYRGVLSPSAALEGAVNLTLFGERYEKVLQTGVERWENPRPELLLPCTLVVEGSPPRELLTDAIAIGQPHTGLAVWERSRGNRRRT